MADNPHVQEPSTGSTESEGRLSTDRLNELLKIKRKVKTALTKARLNLTSILCAEGEITEVRREIRRSLDQMLSYQGETIDILSSLCDLDSKFENELETVQNDSVISELVQKATQFVCVSPPPTQNVQPPDTHDNPRNGVNDSPNSNRYIDVNSEQVERDMHLQLKRVTIPTFDGNKKNYQLFRDAFMQCVDRVNCSDGYKMLQLRQYLKDDALKAIEGFHATSVGYAGAKKRLDDKFGGPRRQILMQLEEVRNMRPVAFNDLKTLSEFSDKLELSILYLKEINRSDEFDENSMFFAVAKSKLAPANITNYKRWVMASNFKENLETLQQWLSSEVNFRIEAHEEVEGFSTNPKTRLNINSSNSQTPINTQSNKYRSNQLDRYTKPRTFATNSDMNRQCSFCKRNHGFSLQNCEEFKTLSVNDRWTVAKQNQLCFRCLSSSHKGRDCRYSRTCSINGCLKTHHQLLHGGGYSDNAPLQRDSQFGNRSVQSNPVSRTHTQYNNSEIGMRVVPVVLSFGRNRFECNALLDDCSTDSYVYDIVASELGLSGNTTKLDVCVLGGKLNTILTSKISLQLHSVDGECNIDFDAFTVANVTGDMRAVDWTERSSVFPHLQGIPFPKLKTTRVDVLIGLNVPEAHRALTEISGCKGEPVARLTPLGWTCVGPIVPIGVVSHQNSFTQFARTYYIRNESDSIESNTDNLLKRMWEIETFHKQSQNLTRSEEEAIRSTERTLSYDQVGCRYSVGIPWRENKSLLESNSNIELATARLVNLERSLLKRPQVAEEYNRIINDHLTKNYIEHVGAVTITDTSTPSYYLPHFAVVRGDKSTTKVRIVMDAKARGNGGVSLNDCIHPGPKLQRELFDVLIRFRSHGFAVVADISEMFLQIGLESSDRNFHKFLWRNLEVAAPIQEYRYNRLVFGNSSSPYLSQAVIRKHCEQNLDSFPLATNSVLNSMYVDDLLDSVSSVEEAIALRRELSALLQKAGFHIRKWLSNDPRILEDIPIEDRVNQLSIEDSELPSHKTLGILWNAEIDSFKFEIAPGNYPFLTKRRVVSKTATVFDPLNLLAPFTIRAKIGIQKTWLLGLNWDEQLPDELSESWNSWFNELPYLRDLSIQRCLKLVNAEIADVSVHTFVDASEKAYAAVSYLRCEYSDCSISNVLIAAKTRVAPLKSISIPRLELCSAVLGVRLALTVIAVLNIVIDKVTFWSDSQNVLYWVRNESRSFKPFIAHRIGEIHESTEPQQWRYVPTQVNSADCATRGLTCSELIKCKLWWSGPEYLVKDSSSWPQNIVPTTSSSDINIELRSQRSDTFVAVTGTDFGRLSPSRYSRWLRLIRVTAWIKRFINNIRNCQNKSNRNLEKALRVVEIECASEFWYKVAQRDQFSDEIIDLSKNQSINNSSRLLSLNPFIAEDGLLRSNSRLAKGDHLSYDAKYPIVLPNKHSVTSLLIKYYHDLGNHECGVSYLLSELRAKFWILKARETVKSVQSSCFECKRRRNRPAQQIMAPLPKFRLGSEPLRAFARTGVDYAGPFLTKQVRGRVRTKRYLCVFTCLASRAVHLEMAYNMDTDSFLLAFSRFTNRRGRPVQVISDNGTNFRGADRELGELIDNLDQDKITNNLSNQRIQWTYNPPLSPHFGGVFESMVKAAKRSLKAILGNADINDEELETAIVKSEGLLNSRPLTYQGDDPNDNPVLTPNHFLIGQLSGQLAPETVDCVAFNPRKRWRRVQELVKQFWHRWMSEFLPMLSSRKKWTQSKSDICVGEIVLVIDPSTPRGKWPLGKVLKTFPGSDGHTRVVDVKIGESVFKRSINRLCPLEVNEL